MAQEETDVQLEDLAKQITANIAAQTAMPGRPPDFMLTEPLSITVKKRDGNYGKRPQVGGEEFRLLRCYAGKRGKLIYVFKPLGVGDFSEAEFDEAQAKKVLSGFESYLKTVISADLDRERREAQEKASRHAEREKLSSRQEYTELGFGSW